MNPKKYKKAFLIIIIPVILISLIIFVSLRTKSQIKEMFKLNNALQNEGYYMGDFEFKMLGALYLLDKGHYIKALITLNNYHKQLQSKEGLLKLPNNSNKIDELDFYLSLQDPETGAFIDSKYPYPTYNEPTENLINHIASLSNELGKPVKLKYPLKYLDDINTPEKLTEFLNNVSYVGKISTKSPQTSYVFARSIISFVNSEDAISKNNLYTFSSEWKESLLKWFYNNQDPETGFWGPRFKKSRQLLSPDLNNTASIIKAFVDQDGNNLYDNFPLKYKDKMILTTIKILSEPMPLKDDLDEIHEWNLKMNKGIAMLTRYLLADASKENKEKAEAIIDNYIQNKFKNNYIPKEGSFSYYPGENQATLDGSSNIFLLKDIGAFSSSRQASLWGDKLEDLGTYDVAQIEQKNLQPMIESEEVNSVRVYRKTQVEDYLKNVTTVFYPQKTEVLDIFDVTPKVTNWLENTTDTMGNWTSKEDVLKDIEDLGLYKVQIFEDKIPLEEMNNLLVENKELTLVGFNNLQIPVLKINFEAKN